MVEPGLISYDDAARWLPAEVRRDIEAALPCPLLPAHEWQHYEADGRPGGNVEHWRCHCGAARRQRPG